MAKSINGFALSAILAGSILLYAGFKGYSVKTALQNVIRGKTPGSGQSTISGLSTVDAVSGSGSSTGSPSVPSGISGSNKQVLQAVAASFGWTGSEWTALDNVEMAEAGYNLTATNPSSGAYGMAQFINGPSEYAQYGGDSTTARGQSIAMCNYIKQRYGTPSVAWAHEQQYNWY